MFVSAGFEVDLRFDDVVERLGITLGLATGFLRVKDVVGAGCDTCDHFTRGTNPLERFDFCHGLDVFGFKVMRLCLSGAT